MVQKQICHCRGCRDHGIVPRSDFEVLPSRCLGPSGGLSERPCIAFAFDVSRRNRCHHFCIPSQGLSQRLEGLWAKLGNDPLNIRCFGEAQNKERRNRNLPTLAVLLGPCQQIRSGRFRYQVENTLTLSENKGIQVDQTGEALRYPLGYTTDDRPSRTVTNQDDMAQVFPLQNRHNILNVQSQIHLGGGEVDSFT